MLWFLWVALLVLQEAAMTLLARAVTGHSLTYHAVASVLAGGLWFSSQFILIGLVVTQINDWRIGVAVGLLYVTATTVGSVAMHWVAMKYLEKKPNETARVRSWSDH